MMPRRARRWRLALALGAGLGLGLGMGGLGCTRTVGTVTLTFLTSPNTDEKPLPSDASATPLTIEVRVEGPGIGVRRDTARWVPGETHLRVPGVDLGDDRIFTVTARNELGEEVARARSLPIDITGEDLDIKLYLSLVGRSSEARTTMTSPRFRHTATPLPDGRILLAGGGRLRVRGAFVVADDPVPHAEIYDPTSGSIVSQVPNCDSGYQPLCMFCPRMAHVAALDLDGWPLLAGGEPTCRFSAERFASGRFEPGGEIGPSLTESAAFATPRGVVVAGGLDLGTGEPSAEAFLATGQDVSTIEGGLHLARYGAAAAALPNGGGVVVGGFVSTPEPCPAVASGIPCRVLGTGADPLTSVTRSIEVYDPETGVFTEIPDGLKEARAYATATALPDGRVVIAGGLTTVPGISQNVPTASVEVFDPRLGATGATCDAPVGNLLLPRWLHAAVPAGTSEDDGRVIIMGGIEGNFGVIGGNVEVIPVGSGCGPMGPTHYLSDKLRVPRAGHTATVMANGAVLIAGGVTTVPDGFFAPEVPDDDDDEPDDVVSDVLDVLWLE